MYLIILGQGSEIFNETEGKRKTLRFKTVIVILCNFTLAKYFLF